MLTRYIIRDDTIATITVQRETAASYWVAGKRKQRRHPGLYFETWPEARAALLVRLEKACARAFEENYKAEDRLDAARGLPHLAP